MSLQATTSQTVGPYFRIGMQWLFKDFGPQVLAGLVVDADGQGVPDAVLELWQADAAGNYAHAEDSQANSVQRGFTGFARVPTAEDGRFRFRTVKPGRVADPEGTLQAPHIVVSVFMRGLLRRLVTRIYFPEDAANGEDYALKLVEPARRPTLIARKSAKRECLLEWNVVLQGAHETVFFDC